MCKLFQTRFFPFGVYAEICSTPGRIRWVRDPELFNRVPQPSLNNLLRSCGHDGVSTREVLVAPADAGSTRPRHAPVTTRIARHAR